MKISAAVAKRIEELLKQKNMSKYRLSLDSGVSRSTLICLLQGRYKSVNLETLINLIRTLQIPISEFFDSYLFDDGNLNCD